MKFFRSNRYLLISYQLFFTSFFITLRKLTVNRINKSLARKALYDNIYADIGDAATNEAAESLRKEVGKLIFQHSERF